MLEDLKEWTRWLCRWLAVWVFAALAFSLLPLGRDSTDGPWPHRSGVDVVTDAATGCQYLRTSGGGITPRVDGHGKQLGCNQ